MDTLLIIQKLKKKRPELANDPLMAELEMGIDAMPEGEDEALALDPMNPKNETGGSSEGALASYLDDEEGEEGADAPMADLDAEEGIDPMAGEDAALPGAEGDEEQPAANYLDSPEEEDEEMEMPRAKPSRTKQTRRFGGFSR